MGSMKSPSRWGWFWIAWLVAELVAQFGMHARAHPRTLSETLWHWFPRRWRRVLLVGLLSLLAWHLASGPDVRPIEVLP